jgi:broad specificity phosphatase PhoE
MSQLTLYLARHGESVSNYKNIFIGKSVDPELTEKGVQQAISLAKSLKGKNITAIFSSTLIRARQTAQIIADELDLQVSHSEDLIEVGLGVLDGHDISDQTYLSVYEKMVSSWEEGDYQISIPDGESLNDVKNRLERFLNENVLNQKYDGVVLLVGHAILWMSFIWALCKNKPCRINEGFMSKTHISVISKNGMGYMLDQINLNHGELSNLKQSL